MSLVFTTTMSIERFEKPSDQRKVTEKEASLLYAPVVLIVPALLSRHASLPPSTI